MNIPDKDTERDRSVFNGDEDVNQNAVRGDGGSEVNEWESGGSDGEKEEESLGTEETEEAIEEEEIYEEA